MFDQGVARLKLQIARHIPDSQYDRALRANIDETVLLVVITEQGENRNQFEDQWNSFDFSRFIARCGTQGGRA